MPQQYKAFITKACLLEHSPPGVAMTLNKGHLCGYVCFFLDFWISRAYSMVWYRTDPQIMVGKNGSADPALCTTFKEKRILCFFSAHGNYTANWLASQRQVI